MDLLLHSFKQFFADRDISMNHRFLLAVSGGLDSSVLCELAYQAGLHFTIAHCNFRLRAEESDRDQEFVGQLGRRFGVQVIVKHFNTVDYASQHRISVQEAARDLRYQWFEQVRQETGAAFTVLAHHADDAVETLLMNFFRGTGLQGLTGIPDINRSHPRLIRPLLHLRRRDLEEYARTRQLPWVEDSSNQSSRYTRNAFRHDVIPVIKQQYPEVEQNLLDNISRLKQTAALYGRLVAEFKNRILVRQGDTVRIPVLLLKPYRDTSLIYEIIRDFQFTEKQVSEVSKLLDAGSGKFIENNVYQIIRHGRWLLFAPRSQGAETVAVQAGQQFALFGGGKLQLQVGSPEDFPIQKTEHSAQLDARDIDFPLVIRRCRQGDYFYPLGLGKKKKLSRFFIDQKLSKHEKENAWVVESAKKILWVVGYRIDERFKVTPSTRKVLQLRYMPTNPGSPLSAG